MHAFPGDRTASPTFAASLARRWRSAAADQRPVLTVILPAYNKARTLEELLRRVKAAPYSKQIIVVDDGSTDATPRILETLKAQLAVEVLRHTANRGKGAAIRTGLERARGRLTIIQDADLEYDPDDYPLLVEPLLSGAAQVVYGSRYSAVGHGHKQPWRVFRLGVSMLNAAVRLLYGARLTDEATCYKAFRTELLHEMELRCERFEFCQPRGPRQLSRRRPRWNCVASGSNSVRKSRRRFAGWGSRSSRFPSGTRRGAYGRERKSDGAMGLRRSRPFGGGENGSRPRMPSPPRRPGPVSQSSRGRDLAEDKICAWITRRESPRSVRCALGRSDGGDRGGSTRSPVVAALRRCRPDLGPDYPHGAVGLGCVAA